MFIQGRKKLDKDDKALIEELATTNAEYKKVNSYLADEIEQLKRENDQLKVELVKVHMSDSLTSSDSSASLNTNHQTDLSSSTPKNIRNLEVLRSKLSLNCSDNSMHTVPCFNTTQISSGSSSASSSSWSISQSSQATNSSQGSGTKDRMAHKGFEKFKSIDLSKYIDNEDEDEDCDEEFNAQYDFDLYHNISGECEQSVHRPPLEFTIDSC